MIPAPTRTPTHPTSRHSTARGALRRITALLGVVLATGALAAGCATPVDVPPGPDAKNPDCARVLRATPDVMLDLERRSATAQASTAWGDPAITLRCGVEVPGPSTDRCLSIELPNGERMDWLNPEASDEDGQAGSSSSDSGTTAPTPGGDGGTWTFVTYGRDPAIEVEVPAGAGLDQPTAVLTELASAVSLVPATRQCLGATDVPLG